MQIKYLYVNSSRTGWTMFDTYELLAQHLKDFQNKNGIAYAILGEIPPYRTKEEATAYIEKYLKPTI